MSAEYKLKPDKKPRGFVTHVSGFSTETPFEIMDQRITNISDVVNELVVSVKQVATTGNGGGNGMDEIKRRVENLERTLDEVKIQIKEKPNLTEIKLILLESEQRIGKLIQELPTEDRIKTIFREEIHSNKLATIDVVENKVSKGTNKLLFWMLGASVTLLAGIATIIIRTVITKSPGP